jgi:Na+-driven multidrug efflux pump
MIPVLVFAPGLVEIFNDTPNVIEYGALLLRYITPFYLLCCVNQILVGAIRGAGDSKATMIMLLASFVFFRQIYLFIFTKIFPGNFLTVAISYPAGWMLASLLTYIYYKKYKLERSSLALDDKSS